MQKVFIAEDDDNIREMIVYALQSAGFEAVGFADGEALLALLQKEAPALILLDIMLPGEQGLSILKKLKQASKFKSIPVIMLTAKGAEYDRIKGLDLGADDYITKPFSVLEVISRIKAVLRRCESAAAAPAALEIGDITLHSDKRAVFARGIEVALTYKEFELLNYLMVNEDIVLTREKLLSGVWGYDYSGESRTVDMHIKSLRQKLGDAGDIIKTVRNVGYKIGV